MNVAELLHKLDILAVANVVIIIILFILGILIMLLENKHEILFNICLALFLLGSITLFVNCELMENTRSKLVSTCISEEYKIMINDEIIEVSQTTTEDICHTNTISIDTEERIIEIIVK